MTLSKFLELVRGKRSAIINYKSEKEALAAVNEDGHALKYVDIRVFDAE